MKIEISDVLLQISPYPKNGTGLLHAITHAEKVLAKRRETAHLTVVRTHRYYMSSDAPTFTCNMLALSGFYTVYYQAYAKRYFKNWRFFWGTYYHNTVVDTVKAEELRCACVAQYLKYLRKKFKAELAEAEKELCD